MHDLTYSVIVWVVHPDEVKHRYSYISVYYFEMIYYRFTTPVFFLHNLFSIFFLNEELKIEMQ
jgi:hypothetical protein